MRFKWVTQKYFTDFFLKICWFPTFVKNPTNMRFWWRYFFCWLWKEMTIITYTGSFKCIGPLYFCFCLGAKTNIGRWQPTPLPQGRFVYLFVLARITAMDDPTISCNQLVAVNKSFSGPKNPSGSRRGLLVYNYLPTLPSPWQLGMVNSDHNQMVLNQFRILLFILSEKAKHFLIFPYFILCKFSALFSTFFVQFLREYFLKQWFNIGNT